MASAQSIKQDLPPAGGYKKLDFSRIPAKRIWNWYTIIPAYIATTAAGFYLYFQTRAELDQKKLENHSSICAMMPVIIAEKDRVFLKNIRKIRDEEVDLMKNVDGWETGTLYGEPVYKTMGKDEFVLPSYNELYAHTKEKDPTSKIYFTFSY